jgi:hypothetical protein
MELDAEIVARNLNTKKILKKIIRNLNFNKNFKKKYFLKK